MRFVLSAGMLPNRKMLRVLEINRITPRRATPPLGLGPVRAAAGPCAPGPVQAGGVEACAAAGLGEVVRVRRRDRRRTGRERGKAALLCVVRYPPAWEGCGSAWGVVRGSRRRSALGVSAWSAPHLGEYRNRLLPPMIAARSAGPFPPGGVVEKLLLCTFSRIGGIYALSDADRTKYPKGTRPMTVREIKFVRKHAECNDSDAILQICERAEAVALRRKAAALRRKFAAFLAKYPAHNPAARPVLSMSQFWAACDPRNH